MGVIPTIILSVLGVTFFRDFRMVLGLNDINNTEQPRPTSWDECLPQRIIGGEPINITDAPFMLGLEIGSGMSYRFRCGAIIISEKVAMTASHCSGSPRNIRVRSGGSKKGEGNVHYLRKIVDHEPSGTSFYDNDISLLFLRDPFVFSDSVQPIKLPEKELEVGTMATTAGYGSTREKPGVYDTSVIVGGLRRVSIPIVDNFVCHEVIKKRLHDLHNITIPNLVTKTMTCAGFPGGKKDACEGDSGGPLYHEGILYGVTSWGLGCAIPCSPGVYANVFRFMDWINRTIEENLEE